MANEDKFSKTIDDEQLDEVAPAVRQPNCRKILNFLTRSAKI